MSSLSVKDTFWPFLTSILKPYKGYMGGVFFALLLAAIHNSLSPYASKLILDAATRAKTSPTSLGWAELFWPSVFFVFLFQTNDFCWRLYDYFILRLVPAVKNDVVAAMFQRICGHSYGFFQKNFSGGVANKVTDMSRGIENIFIVLTETILYQILTLLFAIFFLYQVHISFAITLLIWSVFFVLGILYQSKMAKKLSKSFSEARTRAMGRVVDAITNIIAIKLFSGYAHERRHLKTYLDEALVRDRELQLYMLWMKLFQGFAVTVLLAILLFLLVTAYQQDRITVGDFSEVLGISAAIIQGLWYLGSHSVLFAQEVGNCRQAVSVINTPNEVHDVTNAMPLTVTRGEILFENVSFFYERGQNIFRDKTIKIEGGQKVGLVGFSGSGKTTFANLILRFFDVSEGRILIDGQDISKVRQESLWDQIAVIPQDPLLFHRSILENIRYGRMEASEEDVKGASVLAHCHEFVEKMEQGYQMVVGERGLKLSGGQRQRIAIARAILKNAPILILDEATSALDSVTEKKIQESVNYLMHGRTSLIIAHRLSTLSDMDRILVFHGGSVVEDGTHDELMDQGGHYAKLWAMQAGGFLPEKAGLDE